MLQGPVFADQAPCVMLVCVEHTTTDSCISVLCGATVKALSQQSQLTSVTKCQLGRRKINYIKKPFPLFSTFT